MTDPAPAKPVLALTLALAGKRAVPPDALDPLRTALTLAFDTVAARLGELAMLAEQANDPMAERFSGDAAKLTLLTGLADGVDQLGAELFLEGTAQAENPRRILGAALPCNRRDFVGHSKVEDEATFDRLWKRCSFMIDLGAPMPASPAAAAPGAPPDPKAEYDRRARGDAFSAQSEVLLRNADILVAVDDAGDAGRTGGTRESVRKALEVGIPVILLRLGEAGLAVLRIRADFDEPKMIASPVSARETLRALVDDVAGYRAALREDDYVCSLFAEFFHGDARGAGLLGWLWTAFESWFKPRSIGGSGGEPPAEPAAYAAYKKRASDLCGAYAGQYRGSFLAGYALAILAVAAAVTSLTILAMHKAVALPWGVELGVLFFLGLVKLGAVVGIFWLAGRAHRMKLAHRAADFRYLSERLRAMHFLPAAGWLRSPANWSLPYTSRVAAQGVMDRLFAAIVRQADPLLVLRGTPGEPVVRLDPGGAEATIRDYWLAEQGRYHERNHATLGTMSERLELTNRVLNGLVMAVAGVDLLVLLAAALGFPPGLDTERLHTLVTPVLITFAAILPAAVASLNGVRFQSECTRLADRSKQMAEELCRLAANPPDRGDRPPRMIEVQRLAEDATRLTLGEVAEWSAIYGKDFPEI